MFLNIASNDNGAMAGIIQWERERAARAVFAVKPSSHTKLAMRYDRSDPADDPSAARAVDLSRPKNVCWKTNWQQLDIFCSTLLKKKISVFQSYWLISIAHWIILAQVKTLDLLCKQRVFFNGGEKNGYKNFGKFPVIPRKTWAAQLVIKFMIL